MKIILLLALAAIVVAFFIWRRDREAGREENVTVRNIPAGAAAEKPMIRLRPGTGACSQARQQAGKYYPGEERPRLPLPGCRAHACNCRFEAVKDRRRDERRQHEERRETIRFDDGTGDRRRRDRRSQNADPWGVDRE